MKINLFKGKSKRTQLFTLITIVGIVVVLALNLLLSHFGHYNTIFFDMTPEGLYTISDRMKEECDEIVGQMKASDPDKKVKITFCTDPDYLMSTESARLTYVMALKLQQEYPDMIEVETVNVYLNPTAVSQYKTTSLSTIKNNNIIFSYGGRYRITGFDYYWASGSSGATYYNGEYRVATILKSVAAIARPVAYFLTGHGETVYNKDEPDSAMSKETEVLASLLVERGMEVKLLDLSTVDRVPDDCALLIINNPTEDFTYSKEDLDRFDYVSDTEKIDRYLVMKQGAIAVAKDYNVKLPVLESFLHEWGFKFSDSYIVDEESSLGSNILANYNTDEYSYGYELYGEYADLTSAPNVVFKDAGSIECAFKESVSQGEAGTAYASKNFASFLTTSSKAQRYVVEDGVTYVDGTIGKYNLAALSIRNELDSIENVDTNSFIFCVNSASFFGSELLGNESYANYDVVSAVIENISRVDKYADIDLGAPSQNSAALGGKYIIPMNMTELGEEIRSNRHVDDNVDNPKIVIKVNHGISSTEKTVFTCFILAVPAAIGIIGIIVSIKRRYM